MIEYEKIIQEKDIFNTEGLESIIYSDETKIYKIFNSTQRSYLQNKFYKVNILETLKDFKEGVLPIDNVMDKRSVFRGYSAQKENSLTLLEIHEQRGIYDFLLGLIDSSKKLYNIHSRSEKIIIADVNCNNIIIKENENDLGIDSIFVDMDNISIDGLKHDRYSGILQIFFKPRTKHLRISQNTDRLGQLLYLMSYMFNIENPIYGLKEKDFSEAAEKIQSLKNMKNLITTLQNPRIYLPNIPYLFEMIDPEEIKKAKLEKVL